MNKNRLSDPSQNLTSRCVVWTALVTPFTQHNKIDIGRLQSLANAQAAAGNGILLLGSTGEGLALSGDEQKQIVDCICQLNLDTPLMVAVGGYDLAAQLAWIEYCNALAIDAYLLATPIYAKPGPVGQTMWFSQLLDAAHFPCMLYNVPSRAGVEIPLQTLEALQSHANCWAIKEASGSLDTFLAYQQHCPTLAIFSGEDAMMPTLAQAGAKGLVSVCANAWPEATNAYVKLSLAGQLTGVFPLWKNAIDALFQVANPIPVKAMMRHKKMLDNPYLRAPLTHLELTEHTSLINADQQITLWLAKQTLSPDGE
jgi:4-hydroxy-tetrahydrodipicolinate synthase